MHVHSVAWIPRRCDRTNESILSRGVQAASPGNLHSCLALISSTQSLLYPDLHSPIPILLCAPFRGRIDDPMPQMQPPSAASLGRPSSPAPRKSRLKSSPLARLNRADPELRDFGSLLLLPLPPAPYLARAIRHNSQPGPFLLRPSQRPRKGGKKKLTSCPAAPTVSGSTPATSTTHFSAQPTVAPRAAPKVAAKAEQPTLRSAPTPLFRSR